jgi:hypothetical protein
VHLFWPISGRAHSSIDGDWNEDILLVVKMEKSLGHVHQL